MLPPLVEGLWRVTASVVHHTQHLLLIIPTYLTHLLIALPFGNIWQNFDFKMRRDRGKNSYERRDYESVDEKSLS